MATIEPQLNDADLRNWDLRLPDWVLHFGPCVLALFCLWVSLGDYSVFRGFRENDPGTQMSLALMFVVFVLSLGAMCNRGLDRARRIVGGVTATMSLLAMIDETHQWHEEIGYWVQDNVDWVPERLAPYTDDTIIILGGISGGLILYLCLRATGQARAMRPYLWSVVFAAVAHGVLDLVSHKTVMIRDVFPDMTKQNARSLMDQLSCFEESCKIWTAWFAVIFLQRFFFGTPVRLRWSLMMFAALPLAAYGLWTVAAAESGVPYLTIAGKLLILRNYPALIMLCFVWLAWAVVVWCCHREHEARCNLAGLLFLCPLAITFGKLDVAEWMGPAVESLTDTVLPNAYWSARVPRFAFLAVLLVVPGVIAGLVPGIALRRAARLSVIGYLLPLLAIVLLPGCWNNPLWIAVFATVIAVAAYQVYAGTVTKLSRRAWLGLSLGTVGLTVILLGFNLLPLLPNHRYRDRDAQMFRVHQQALPPTWQW